MQLQGIARLLVAQCKDVVWVLGGVFLLGGTMKAADSSYFEANFQLPPQLPPIAKQSAAQLSRVQSLKTQIAKFPTFADLRELAAIYEASGFPNEAAQLHRRQATMYRQRHCDDAAIIEEAAARRCATNVQFFADRPLSTSEIQASNTGAPLEPAVGCYIGAFIDQDDNLRHVFAGENYQWHHRPEDFAKVVGKKHATYFTYLRYGQSFPRTWLEHCKAAKVIPHIAWEPTDLNQVQADSYLQDFARQLGELDWPVFVRFAAEMNGCWTPYHSDPALYRQKFRLVHEILHHWAPQVATIWAVNNVPLEPIPDYYPGDDGCDWVGIDVYNVRFYNNDPKRPGFQDNPATLIEPIYQLYADRKPIAICEYGASHMADDGVLREDFTIEKMMQLYSALPLVFPRIKMISWFDMNCLKNAPAGRRINDYSLTGQTTLCEAYRATINSDYFLSDAFFPKSQNNVRYIADTQPKTPSEITLPRPLGANQSCSGETRFSLWVKTLCQRPKVFVRLNNTIVHASDSPGAHTFTVDLSGFPTGPAQLTALVFDESNHLILSKTSTISIQKAPNNQSMVQVAATFGQMRNQQFAPAPKTMPAPTPVSYVPGEAKPAPAPSEMEALRNEIALLRGQLADIHSQLATYNKEQPQAH